MSRFFDAAPGKGAAEEFLPGSRTDLGVVLAPDSSTRAIVAKDRRAGADEGRHVPFELEVLLGLTALERETVILMNDAEDWAEIHTAQRSVITRLRKNPAATLVEEGADGSSVWAKYRVPKELVSVRTKTARRGFSASERQRRADRLRQATGRST